MAKKTKKRKKKSIPGVAFMREVVLELQRTEWLSTKEVAKLSLTVLLTAGTLGVVLYSLDLLFQRIIGLII